MCKIINLYINEKDYDKIISSKNLKKIIIELERANHERASMKSIIMPKDLCMFNTLMKSHDDEVKNRNKKYYTIIKNTEEILDLTNSDPFLNDLSIDFYDYLKLLYGNKHRIVLINKKYKDDDTFKDIYDGIGYIDISKRNKRIAELIFKDNERTFKLRIPNMEG